MTVGRKLGRGGIAGGGGWALSRSLFLFRNWTTVGYLLRPLANGDVGLLGSECATQFPLYMDWDRYYLRQQVVIPHSDD